MSLIKRKRTQKSKSTSKRGRADQTIDLARIVKRFEQNPIDGVTLSFVKDADGCISGVKFNFTYVTKDSQGLQTVYDNSDYCVDIYTTYSDKYRYGSKETKRYRIEKSYQRVGDYKSSHSVYQRIVERYTNWAKDIDVRIGREIKKIEEHDSLQREVGTAVYKTTSYRKHITGRRQKLRQFEHNWVVLKEEIKEDCTHHSAAIEIEVDSNMMFSIKAIKGQFTGDQLRQLIDFLKRSEIRPTYEYGDSLDKVLTKEGQKFNVW